MSEPRALLFYRPILTSCSHRIQTLFYGDCKPRSCRRMHVSEKIVVEYYLVFVAQIANC